MSINTNNSKLKTYTRFDFKCPERAYLHLDELTFENYFGKVYEECGKRYYYDKEIEEKYLSEMKRLKDESEHDLADGILCNILKELGYTELVEVYDKLPKWYS